MLPVVTSCGRLKPHIARRRVAIPNTRAHANYSTFINLEGPGSGKRKAPFSLGQQIQTSRLPGPGERFAMLSAAEMENNFPIWVHSSTPPVIVDHEPAGFIALCNPSVAAGPNSGLRRPPMPQESNRPPPLPYPPEGSRADLKRDLMTKKNLDLFV